MPEGILPVVFYIEERLQEHTGGENGCLLWTGGLSNWLVVTLLIHAHPRVHRYYELPSARSQKDSRLTTLRRFVTASTQNIWSPS